MKSSRKLLLLLLVLSGILNFPASACLWDRDTLRDEKNLHPDLYDLITGKIPHHGDAYYLARIERLKEVGEKRALTEAEKNDLAVAQIRLKRFDEAHDILTGLLADDAGNYYAQSNLGVLEKKRGNYSLAAEHIKKALQLKPGGHMGLGDWYLKQLVYRAEPAEDSDRIPSANFLGEAYKDSFQLNAMSIPESDTKTSEHFLRIQRLIQNDRTFPDAYLVLGDHLSKTGELNLAFLAYTKAIDLGHRNPSEIRRRRRALLKHFEAYVDRKKFIMNALRTRWWERKITEAQKQLAVGESWLKEFQSVEARLVRGKQDEVSFEEVYQKRPALKPKGKGNSE